MQSYKWKSAPPDGCELNNCVVLWWMRGNDYDTNKLTGKFMLQWYSHLYFGSSLSYAEGLHIPNLTWPGFEPVTSRSCTVAYISCPNHWTIEDLLKRNVEERSQQYNFVSREMFHLYRHHHKEMYRHNILEVWGKTCTGSQLDWSCTGNVLMLQLDLDRRILHFRVDSTGVQTHIGTL